MTNKRKRIMKKNNKCVRKVFDKTEAERIFLSLLPELHPARAKDFAVITVKSYWKKGELTKVEVNGQDSTVHVPGADKKINEILQMSRRFRFNYSGAITLIGKKQNGKVNRLEFEQFNRIY